MESVHALDLVEVRVSVRLDPVANVYPTQDQHSVGKLDLPARFGREPAPACVHPTRLQRAPQGAGESAGRGRHHVIEGRGVGWEVVAGDPVVLGDLGVNPEGDRSVAGR
jgi:hypothetical protein